MTPYEQREVLEYPEVWFLGLEAKKIEGVPGAPQNSGYDDENGSYHKVPHDHMAYRYEILEVIGKGSFGQVVKVSRVGRGGEGLHSVPDHTHPAHYRPWTTRPTVRWPLR